MSHARIGKSAGKAAFGAWLGLVLLGACLVCGSTIANSAGSRGERVFQFDPASLPEGSPAKGWQAIWTSEKQAWRVETRHGVPRLVHRSDLNTPRVLLFEEAGGAVDAEIVARMKATSSTATQNRLVVRAGGERDSETSYQFDFRPRNIVRISKYVNGHFQRIGDEVTWEREPTGWTWVRFRAEGDLLMARIWADGEPEPEEWTLERRDDSIPGPGGIGLGSFGAEGTRYYDHIGIAVNGASVELPPLPAEVARVRLSHRDGMVGAVKGNDGGNDPELTLTVPLHAARADLRFTFQGPDGRAYPVDPDEYRLDIEMEDPGISRFSPGETNPFAGNLHGVAAGATTLRLRLLNGNDVVFESARVTVEVPDDRTWRKWVNLHSPFPRADPEEVGMSPQGLGEMKRTLHRYVETGEIVGGIMMVVRHGKLVFFETSGWNDRAKGLLMEPDQIFQVRSMTKMLTGTSLLMLMEEGWVNPSDRISDHLESWNNDRSREITVHQLLSHTGGMSGPVNHGAANLIEAAAEIGERGPAFEPGSRYRYSDAGSSTLGALVGVLSGHLGCEPFKHERIYKPLGMVDTFCNSVPEGDPRRERVAARYSGGKGNWSRYSVAGEMEAANWCRASGGVYSTIFDWSRFMAALLNDGEHDGVRLLRPETVELATQVPHSAEAYSEEERARETRYYGYHFEMATDRFGKKPSPMSPYHFGHGGSDGTKSFVDPQYGLIALFFTQSRFHRRTGENSRERFIELVYEAIVE